MALPDVTLDTPVDGTVDLDEDFFNYNVRDALQLVLRPSTAVVYRSTSQSVSVSPTWTVVSWTGLESDSQDESLPSWSDTNPTRILVRTPGWYEATADIPFQYLAGGQSVTVVWRLNGNSSYMYGADSAAATGTNWVVVTCCVPIKCTSTSDYVECLVRPSVTSSPPTINPLWNTPRGSLRRLRGI